MPEQRDELALHLELGDQGERGGTLLVDLWKRIRFAPRTLN